MNNKESTKTKSSSSKKSSTITAPNGEFETFMKNQQNIVTRLKLELKSLINKIQLNDCDTAARDKSILELEQNINQREADIYKLTNELEALREDNKQILLEFNAFKEKFYQLEIDYDRNLTLQREENEKLLEKLENQESKENQQIQELSSNCQEFKKKLENNNNELEMVNKLYKETLLKLEQMQMDFENQQKEFDLNKNLIQEEMLKEREMNKLDLAKAKGELLQKDKQLQQCLIDKTLMEKEKNLIIDELNNKICRIERAFSQPTKVVQPMVSLPPQTADNSDNNCTSETSNEIEVIAKPQLRKPLENISLHSASNNDNQQAEKNQMPRNYKFKRPVLPVTSSQQTNVAANLQTNRKRRNQPVRQPTIIKNYNEFSSFSSEDDDDKDSNYADFSQKLWRPNTECVS
ncbi:uncharacterized protein ACRADG_005399 isoform 2-T3 [Cochliomyia hominivorax]